MRTPPNSNVAVCANECVADAGRFHTLLPALKWLDDRLEQAVAAARLAIGPAAGGDPFRGLYLQQQEIEQLVVHPVGESQFFLHEERADDAWPTGDAAASARSDSPRSLPWRSICGSSLSPWPPSSIYERIYAYLQDDVSRKRPTVDLAMHLLGGSPGQRLNRWSHLLLDAPLIRNGLLSLIPDPQLAQPPKLACVLKIDDQVVQWLLGIEGLDRRIGAVLLMAAADGPFRRIAVAA